MKHKFGVLIPIEVEADTSEEAYDRLTAYRINIQHTDRNVQFKNGKMFDAAELEKLEVCVAVSRVQPEPNDC